MVFDVIKTPRHTRQDLLPRQMQSSILMLPPLLPYPELRMLRVIFAFCGARVAQTAEINRKTSRSTYPVFLSVWHTHLSSLAVCHAKLHFQRLEFAQLIPVSTLYQYVKSEMIMENLTPPCCEEQLLLEDPSKIIRI